MPSFFSWCLLRQLAACSFLFVTSLGYLHIYNCSSTKIQRVTTHRNHFPHNFTSPDEELAWNAIRITGQTWMGYHLNNAKLNFWTNGWGKTSQDDKIFLYTRTDHISKNCINKLVMIMWITSPNQLNNLMHIKQNTTVNKWVGKSCIWGKCNSFQITKITDHRERQKFHGILKKK